MKPIFKARKLIKKFESIEREEVWHDGMKLSEAKECALIAVNEILDLGYEPNDKSSFNVYNYYLRVKTQIEKL